MKLFLLATAAASAAALSLRVQPKMSVAVFGATGLTGRECTHQLLERGVPVRALCRDPAKLLTPLGSTGKEDLVENEQLYKYKGSVTNAAVRAQRPGCTRRWRAVEQCYVTASPHAGRGEGLRGRRRGRRHHLARRQDEGRGPYHAHRRCVLVPPRRHRRDTVKTQARPPSSPR